MARGERLVHRALPLRWRLVVAALVGAVGFAIGFAAFASWQIDRLEDRNLTSALQARIEIVRDELRPDGTLVADEPSPRTSLVQVLGPSGTVRAATPPLRSQPPLVSLPEVLERGSKGVQREIQLRHTRLTLLAVPLRVAASSAGPAGTGAVVVATESEGFSAARDQLRYILVIGLGVVVPLAGILAWLLAGNALKTVTGLTEEAEAVGLSDLGRGLAVPARDPELSRLVTALNRMLGRVADGFEHQRRFAADASHRLRTPLATLRAEAELALAAGDPEEMRRALADVIADADNLSDLVNRLLASHRQGSAELQPLEKAVEVAAQRWRRQAGAAGLALECDVEELPAQRTSGNGHAPSAPAGDGQQPPVNGASHVIDPHVLRSVLDPLVENAVQHTDSGGKVCVSLRPDGADLIVDVRDTGHGVSEQVRDRLFRPWTTTRAERGGAGLGLWLSRESAQATGGDVVLLDDRPGNTTFRARLPLS